MSGTARNRLVAGLVATAMATAGCASSTTIGRGPAPFPQPSGRAGTAVEHVAQPLPTPVLVDLLETARHLEGRPYRLGGDDPATGFDCSGFVWYVFATQAIAMPRTAAEQYAVGRPVAPDAIEAGDLVFFSTTAPGPSHVGIALDDHTLIHAPSTGSSVRVERFDTTYWLSRLTGVRRIELPPAG